jgi:hypothetical protein
LGYIVVRNHCSTSEEYGRAQCSNRRRVCRSSVYRNGGSGIYCDI